MVSKFTVALAASMAVFAAAGGIDNSCNTGPVQCCNSVYKGSSAEANWLKSLLNIVIPVDLDVGTQCSPLSVVGVGGGASCSSQPVCCSGNHFKGLVVVGCSPININI